MTSFQKKRFLLISALLLLGAIGISTLLWVFNESVIYFYTPTDLSRATEKFLGKKGLRLGGLVENGSLFHTQTAHGPSVQFRITDGHHAADITYQGVLPDLFREGQGVVVDGTLTPPTPDIKRPHITARQVLAKHDESYRPPISPDPIQNSKESLRL